MKLAKLTYIIGSLGSGGAERQLLELIKRIDRNRFTISLVLFEDSTQSCATGLVDEIFSLQIELQQSKTPIRGISTVAAIWRLTRYLQRSKPNIVHAILPASCILAAPAAKLAGVPAVIAGRRSMLDGYRRGGLQGVADRIATRMCNVLVGNSNSVSREVVEIDGMPSERVMTIHNGVDTNRFCPGNRDLRKQYGWNDEHVVFGIVANFIPYKRHSDFVRAAALIAKSNPNARFVMAGEDRGILNDLTAQIHESALGPLFTVIPGTPEPERLYPAMDVYICTSQTEGLSNVLIEAGACGLPVIATRVGGNPEIVVDNYTGYLVESQQPEAVASKALQLSSNPELRYAMGERARQRVTCEFSMIRMVNAHEKLYESLLAQVRGVRAFAAARSGGLA